MSETTLRICRDGAALIVCASLNLLATIEDADVALLPDEVRLDAERLRALADEWIEEDEDQ